MVPTMSLNEEIDQYINYFRQRLPEITSIASPHYRKTLYVTLLDCLSRAGFPSIPNHRLRFVTFIDKCSNWKDKDRVSTPQLKLTLDNSTISSGALYDAVSARLDSWTEGAILRPDSDPTFDELRTLMNANEQHYVEKARYPELLYTYRNHLVHEFRQPGYGIELSDDPSTPYYHSMTASMTGSSWELVFPAQFFHGLCDNSIAGLEVHLKNSNLNPYEAYQFGTLWQRPA